MRRAAKKDITHHDRVAEMKRLGLRVQDSAVAGGSLLDCHVSHTGSRDFRWVEIKNDGRGKPTPKAQAFIDANPEDCFVVRSRADVVALWELLRR